MVKSKKNKLLKFLGYFLSIMLGVAVTLSILKISQPEPWSPLGPYPEQKIITEQPEKVRSNAQQDLLIPITSLSNGNIIVSGSKCSKEAVEVEGFYGWWSAYPGGFHVEAPDGPPGKRIKGCQSFTFENEIPDEIKEWAAGQIAKGRAPEVYLSGCETPIKDNGDKGTEVCWTTETFAFNK